MTFNELRQLIVKDIIHYYFEENISESHVEPLKPEQKKPCLQQFLPRCVSSI